MEHLKFSKTIVLDIDGVLADFEYEMCERFGYKNRNLYSPFSRYPDVDRGLIEEFLISPDVYRDAVPIFGGIRLCTLAQEKEWNVILMTARATNLYDVTLNWLADYNIFYNSIYFTQDKAQAIDDFNKNNPDHKIKALVDDGILNLTDLPLDVTGIAWEQPWNVDWWPRAKYDEIKMKCVVQLEPNSAWFEFFGE